MNRPNQPIVLNALLRCFGCDDNASELFERVQQVPGLWVYELEARKGGESWDEWLADTQSQFLINEEIIASMTQASHVSTLHITVKMSEIQAAVIPPGFSQLIARLGISIELMNRND